MKKFQHQFSSLKFSFLLIGVIVACAWQKPVAKQNSNYFANADQLDTLPKSNTDREILNSEAFDKAMEALDKNMDTLDVQMKNLNINIDQQIAASLSKINVDEIAKQTEASLKQIDWNAMQQNVNNSLQQAQHQIAQIDFKKMQNQIEAMQQKLQSDDFKSQFNSEKLHKQIDDAMSKAKEGIEKAKQKMQALKDFTNALETDGLINKKNGYSVEWQNGDLYINDKKQPKNISDKYRKYEKDFDGKIKMLPEGAEHF